MRIIASGTFDHLHDGHKLFIGTALERGYALIGLTVDSMTEGKEYAALIQSYDVRKGAIIEWLALEGYTHGKEYEIIPISTPVGFACDMARCDAILVTVENEGMVAEINRCRALRGLKPLRTERCRLLEDRQGKISSTRIRSSIG
jgi:phosphopantetheine adenylyltransferase